MLANVRRAFVREPNESVRDACFGGEKSVSLEQARDHARHWCLEEYGMRPHSRQGRG